MGYCERCGGRFDFEGICEICGHDEEWSWNTPHNPNKVKCENCGAEIYEVRRFCHVCGEKNEAAFKKGREYCPRCGIAFENEVCPECGRTLSHFRHREIATKDKIKCSACGKETCSKDNFCVHCGNENYRKPWQRPSPKFHRAEEPLRKESENYRRSEEPGDCTAGDIEKELKVTNSMFWSILGLLQAILFCMPTGLVSYYYSIKTTELIKRGRFRRAKEKLALSKKWFLIGVAVDVVLIIAFAVLRIFQII